MVRPLKGKKRFMIRTFSYDGELDQSLNAAMVKAASEYKTFSEVLLLGLELYAKTHWKDLQFPELAKALNERAKARAKAERILDGQLVDELEQLKAKPRDDWPSWKRLFDRSMQKAAKRLATSGSIELSREIAELQDLGKSWQLEDKRLKAAAVAAADEQRKKAELERQEEKKAMAHKDEERAEHYKGSQERIKKLREAARPSPGAGSSSEHKTS